MANYLYSLGDPLSDDSIVWFEKMNKGWYCTGHTLREEITDKFGVTHGTVYAIMEGEFTRYGMCRDCGDHYIIARWSRYDRIDKETLDITFDVDDK